MSRGLPLPFAAGLLLSAFVLDSQHLALFCQRQAHILARKCSLDRVPVDVVVTRELLAVVSLVHVIPPCSSLITQRNRRDCRGVGVGQVGTALAL